MRKPALLSAAGFSTDREHRYWLTREWDAARRKLVVIGLNPSTADELVDDPTIRRCIGFADRWGCGALVMLNLFAFRSTDPAALERVSDPIGDDNDRIIDEWTAQEDGQAPDGAAPLVLCAWGVRGDYLGRARWVLAQLEEAGVQPVALGFTKAGHPRHPLYVRGDTKPVPMPKVLTECGCCARAGEYNGFGSDGPRAFLCTKEGGCPCHD